MTPTNATAARVEDRSGDCVCGVAVSLHFDIDNRRLVCAAAADRRERMTATPVLPLRPVARVLSFPDRGR